MITIKNNQNLKLIFFGQKFHLDKINLVKSSLLISIENGANGKNNKL